MKKTRVGICCTLAVTMGLAGGPAMASVDMDLPGTAAEVFQLLDSASDPQATFEALSADQQDVFTDYYLPAREEVTVTLTPAEGTTSETVDVDAVTKSYSSVADARASVAAAQGCYGGYVKRTAYSSVNIALWDMYTEGTWCGSGGKVTSASFSRSWTTIGTIGWRDGGQIGKGSGIVNGQARIWAQRKMIFGTGVWDIQTMQPCLRLNGTSAGGKSQSVVCSIY